MYDLYDVYGLYGLYDLYDLYGLYDLDLPGRADLFPMLHDLAHVAGWEPYHLHDICSTRYLGWICTTQVLQSISQRQVRI